MNELSSQSQLGDCLQGKRENKQDSSPGSRWSQMITKSIMMVAREQVSPPPTLPLASFIVFIFNAVMAISLKSFLKTILMKLV